MTNDIQLLAQRVTIEHVLSKANGGEVSILAHDIAIRRPLADLVETAIVATCNSPHTARKYRRNIGEFIALLGATHFADSLLVERITHGKRGLTVFDYGDTPAGVLLLVNSGLLDTFAKAHKQGLHPVRSFLRVAFRDNVLAQAQAQRMGITPYRTKQTRHTAPTGRRLSAMEVQFLRSSPDVETPGGARDLAILDCALYAGLRRQEIAELRLSDLRQDSGRWTIYLVGKGGKVRKIAVHSDLFASLARWLDLTGRAMGDDSPVFLRIRKGGKVLPDGITPQTVSDLVAKYGHKAGLSSLTGKNRLTPHDGRRTFARRLHDCGASLAAIQKLLGHSDPATTALYVCLADDDAKDAVDLLRY